MEEISETVDIKQNKPTTFSKESKLAYVYMVRCADATLYVGWTFNPKARTATHNSGKGAKYTRSRLPVELVYLEQCHDESTARKREIALKRLSRAQKLTLISSQGNQAELEVDMPQ